MSVCVHLSNPPPSTQSAAMKDFVILFRQGPHTLTEADLASRQLKVSAWARAQNAAGHRLEPRILAPPGIGGDALLDAHPVTALLFLQADGLAEAARIAESHPAIDFGASVEVRPWAPPVGPVPATRPA
jgi:hypothetical protein